MIKDYFLIPWKEMHNRKLRSLLTLFGIIIGIASVVSLINLGQGLQQAITGQVSALGNDKLIITAKGNPLTAGLSIDAIKITTHDMDVIRKVSGVKQAAGFLYSSSKIEFNNEARYFFVDGFPTNKEENTLINSAQSYKIAQGRNIASGDRYKVVLGSEYTNPDLFGKDISLGNKILIKEHEFKIIGFWQKTGSPQDDKSAIIPIDTYQELFQKNNELGLIFVQINPGEDLNLMDAKIKKELRKSRHLKEDKEDFSIQTPQQLVSTFDTVLNIVQVVLIGIAAISLFVGGIGIMNTMFTAVLQRTKEIGLFKAIGATNRQILTLFLIESGLYGLIGGILGVLIGMLFAKIIEYIFSQFIGSLLVIQFQWTQLLAIIFFSFIIGCISGFTPARKASKLNAIDSLRYE